MTEKTANYCYHCGNRLIKKSENCWYCGVPIHREIRSVRRCPFCAEPIRPEAVKCRHCGEFLDGRPRVEQKPIQQMVVVDKELLQAMSDLRLFPGLPVPEQARQALDERTVRAIEDNHPEEIKHPGVRLLPAPSGSPIMVEGKPGSAPLARRSDAPPDEAGPRTAPLARRAGAPGEEVEPDPTGGKRLPVAPRRGAAKQPPAARRAAPLAPLQPGERPGKAGAAVEEEGAVDAEVSETFRNCANCGTEILVIDNFCYHCGTQYHRTQADKLREARERRRRAARAFKLLVVLAILAGGAAAVYHFYIKGLSPEELQSAKDKVLKGAKGAIGAGMETLGMIDKDAVAHAEQCRINLAAIDAAKASAAKIAGIESGPVDLKLVLAELGVEELPKCPAGGSYSIGDVQQPVACSIGDNGTPTKLDDHIRTDQ